MKEINLRDFYPWYKEDVIIEVTEEVAEELLAGQRYIKASRRRVYRNKAHYSLDAEDGIEYSACFSNPSPQELIERMERFEQLCHALNSLPDAQGQRVFEHFRVYDFHYAAIQLSTFQHFSSPLLILPHISEKAQLSLDFFDSLRGEPKSFGSPLLHRTSISKIQCIKRTRTWR